MKRVVTLMLLICLLCQTTSFAQSSSGAAAPARPTKNQQILSLLQQNDAAEAELARLRDREQALMQEVARADDATQGWRVAHDKALIELGETRAESKSLRAELEVNKLHLEELRTQRDETRGERDAARAEVKQLKRENRLLILLTIVRTVADVVKIVH